MPSQAFRFFLETRSDPVLPEGALWRQPLRMAAGQGSENLQPRRGAGIRYGDYFEAIREFLLQDGGSALRRTLAKRGGRSADAAAIRTIDVFLVKHGAFYHPARIEVDIGRKRPRCFVLNVAASETGNARLEEECRSLNRLLHHSAARFVPRVYARGEVKTAGGRRWGMWLGEWFNGFHEFHWSRNEATGRPAVAVWNPRAGKRHLNAEQAGSLYCQAAAVLTRFYDLLSFEQVYPWHHAAGDFVVRLAADRLDVRLITVRGYRSLFAAPPGPRGGRIGADLIMQALLLFVIRLSLRMRLDRLDGVGELFWADAAVVPDTLKGVRRALAEKTVPAVLPDAPLRCFDIFTSTCSEADLQELITALADLYPPDHPERAILQAHTREHAAALCRALASR